MSLPRKCTHFCYNLLVKLPVCLSFIQWEATGLQGSLWLVRLTEGKQDDKQSHPASLSSIFPSLKTPFIRQMEHHHWSTSMLICISSYEHYVKGCVCLWTSRCIYMCFQVYMYICFQVWMSTAVFACIDICVWWWVCAWAEDSILDTELQLTKLSQQFKIDHTSHDPKSSQSQDWMENR